MSDVSFSLIHIYLIRGGFSSFAALGRDKNCRSPITTHSVAYQRFCFEGHLSDARIEAPKARELRRRGWKSLGSGLASSPAVDGPVERREVPRSAGSGTEPRPPTILVHSGPKERRWWHSKYHIVGQPGSSNFLCFCFIKQPCDNECGSGVLASS